MNEGLGERLLELLDTLGWASAMLQEDAQRIVNELLADAAAQRWVEEQLRQTGIRSMDFRKGAAMDLKPSRELLGMMLGACRGLLQDAPNYSETRVAAELDLKAQENPEKFTVVIQRHGPGVLTPHEARMRAEAVIERVWEWISDVNDGAGYDTGDLALILERGGFPPGEE